MGYFPLIRKGIARNRPLGHGEEVQGTVRKYRARTEVQGTVGKYRAQWR